MKLGFSCTEGKPKDRREHEFVDKTLKSLKIASRGVEKGRTRSKISEVPFTNI